jgi:hypothetical protein
MLSRRRGNTRSAQAAMGDVCDRRVHAHDRRLPSLDGSPLPAFSQPLPPPRRVRQDGLAPPIGQSPDSRKPFMSTTGPTSEAGLSFTAVETKGSTSISRSLVGREVLGRTTTSIPIVAPFRRRYPDRAQQGDAAIAERETHIQPNGAPDDRRRKLVAGKRDRHAPSYPTTGCALTFA